MPDLVKVVLHITRRRRGLSGFARRASAAIGVALRFAVVGIACFVLVERPEMKTEASAALAIGLLWATVAPLLSKPQAPHALVLLTDESLVYAEGATCLDWPDVKSHAVVGDHLIFEPTDEARKEDPVVKRRYSIPLGEKTRAAVVEAFQSRPRARPGETSVAADRD